ncbi:MAG: response regulator [Spirochaetales bacterium]|nr:response regulator [Spirochaetales bacterium]
MKVLLVDDEKLTLNYLAKIIDWDSMNIHIVGKAENGESALEIFKDSRPELIITDIQMPLMDGLTLIKEIRSISSTTKIIVLSAFGDFEYARKAFSCGITGYILKPIDESKLEIMLNQAVVEIEEEREEQRLKKIKTNLACETYLKRRLFHPEKAGPFHKKIMELGMEGWFSEFQLISLLFQDHSLDQTILSGLIRETWEKVISGQVFILIIAPREWLLIGAPVSHSTGVSFIDKLKLLTGLEIFMGISRIYNEPGDLIPAYREIGILNALSFYEDSSPLFYTPDIEIQGTLPAEEEEMRSFMAILKMQDQKKLHTYLRNLENRMRAGAGIDLEAYYGFCLTLLILVRSQMERELPSFSIPEELKKLSMERIKEFKTSSELTGYILKICTSILSLSSRNFEERLSRFIPRTKEFIKEHYSENITLDQIGTHLSVSRNYLSRIFKEETGIKIWDYLTEIRMEKARELLVKTNLKTSDIAEKVGYENATYFSSIFKKVNGLPPKEYRNSIG